MAKLPVLNNTQFNIQFTKEDIVSIAVSNREKILQDEYLKAEREYNKANKEETKLVKAFDAKVQDLYQVYYGDKCKALITLFELPEGTTWVRKNNHEMYGNSRTSLTIGNNLTLKNPTGEVVLSLDIKLPDDLIIQIKKLNKDESERINLASKEFTKINRRLNKAGDNLRNLPTFEREMKSKVAQKALSMSTEGADLIKYLTGEALTALPAPNTDAEDDE